MEDTKSYKPGDEIFSAYPIIYCIMDDAREMYCHGCLTKSESLTPCGICNFAFYCADRCRKRNSDVHKLECKFLKVYGPNYPNEWERFIGLSILMLKKQRIWDVVHEVGSVTRTFRDLIPNPVDFENSETVMAMFCKRFIFQCTYLNEDMIAYEDYLPIHAKIWKYHNIIYNSSDRPLALAVYPGLSLFEHSCGPNAVDIYSGLKLHLRVLKPIPSEKQPKVTFDRFRTEQRRSERLETVRYMCLKECECHRCVDDEFENVIDEILQKSTVEGALSVHDQVEDYLDCLEEMEYNSDFEMMLETCEDCLIEMDGVVGERNVLRVRVLQYAYIGSWLMEDFAATRDYLRKLLKIYQFYYMRTHPTVVFTKMKMALMEVKLKNVEVGKQLFSEALQMMEITHGKNNSEYCNLLRKAEDIETLDWRPVSRKDNPIEFDFD